MITERRARLALLAMLGALAILLIAACRHADDTQPVRYTPAGNTAVVEQQPAAVDTGSATEIVTNTVDPPAAHDSDMPTGEPTTQPEETSTGQTTAQDPPSVPNEPSALPATPAPPPRPTEEPKAPIVEDPCSTPAGCQK